MRSLAHASCAPISTRQRSPCQREGRIRGHFWSGFWSTLLPPPPLPSYRDSRYAYETNSKSRSSLTLPPCRAKSPKVPTHHLRTRPCCLAAVCTAVMTASHIHHPEHHSTLTVHIRDHLAIIRIISIPNPQRHWPVSCNVQSGNMAADCTGAPVDCNCKQKDPGGGPIRRCLSSRCHRVWR